MESEMVLLTSVSLPSSSLLLDLNNYYVNILLLQMDLYKGSV